MSRVAPTPLSLEDERRLLARLHAGDRAAFRTLYEAFAARLYRAVILPRVSLEDVAEDILRDTFMTAFEKIGSVRWQERSLYYWLSRIAANKVVDFHRANQRTQRFVEGFAPFVELSQPLQPTPEAALVAEQSAARRVTLCARLLDGLNPRYRRAVELRFFEGRSREACAEALAVTVGNFDVILFRAIKRLKALSEGLCDDDATP